MNKHPLAMAISLAFVSSIALSACDRASNFTEQELIQRAKDFEDKGALKESVIELKNAIQMNPSSPQARLLLGQVYLKVGMGAEAEKEFTQAKALGLSAETINPYLGEALLLTGDFKRVLDEIQPGGQSTKAKTARILQLRADALLGSGKLQDACNLYEQSLRLYQQSTSDNTVNPATYWGLAQCAIAEHDNKKAREWLNTALKVNDRQAKTWNLIGNLEQIDKNPEAAISAHANSLKIDPDNLTALEKRAIVNAHMGRLEPARLDIEKIRTLYPKSVAANYLQALLKFREKKYPEARGALQEGLKAAPEYPPLLLLGGLIENALGNLQTAESYLTKAARAAPRNGFVLSMLATTQLGLGRPDDAANTLASIDIEKAQNAYLHALAGEIALEKSDFAKAAAHFEAASHIKPDNAALRTELGIVRLEQGDSRALADLQAAADMENSSTRADTVILVNHLNEKQFDAALERIAQIEKKQPLSPLMLNYQGAAFGGNKNVAKARSSFEQALILDPDFFPAILNLAKLDLAEGHSAQASKRFESILKSDPSNLESMIALADFALRANDEKAYTSWLQKAIQAHPQTVHPRAKLASYYLDKKNPKKALELAREINSANPDNPQSLEFLGNVQLAAGDRANAIATYSKLTVKAEQSPDAFLRLALAQIADKRMGEARVSLLKALRLKPDHLYSQDALLQLELAEKHPDAALKIAKQMQAQRLKSPIGLEREGDILMAQKRYLDAVKPYEQALVKAAGIGGMLKLHRALSAAGDNKAAEQRLTGWIQQHPQDVALRSYAAAYFMQTQHHRESIAQYEALLKIRPSDVAALNNLANLYQIVQDPRALTMAEKAIKLAPNHPSVQDTLGWILVKQGQITRGLDFLRNAVAKAPKSANLHYHYGVALARSGNKSEARRELETAIKSGQNFPELEAAKAFLKNL